MKWRKFKDDMPSDGVLAVVCMKNIDDEIDYTFYKLARYNGGWKDAEYTKDLGKDLEEVCDKEYSAHMWYEVTEDDN